MNEVILAGRMVGNPVKLPSGEVHFQFEADPEVQVTLRAPFHCFCSGTAAANILNYCQDGDEFSIEGKLAWKKFTNEKKARILVEVKYTSYGRKLRTLR